MPNAELSLANMYNGGSTICIRHSLAVAAEPSNRNTENATNRESNNFYTMLYTVGVIIRNAGMYNLQCHSLTTTYTNPLKHIIYQYTSQPATSNVLM